MTIKMESHKTTTTHKASPRKLHLLLLLGFVFFLLTRHAFSDFEQQFLKEVTEQSMAWSFGSLDTSSRNDSHEIKSQQQPPLYFSPSVNYLIPGRSVDYDSYAGFDKENDEPNTNLHHMLFVHVGKSGGQTLKYALKAGCDSMVNKWGRKKCYSGLPQSEISNRVDGYVHVDTQTTRLGDADGFLIVARHPIERFISWYNGANPTLCVSKKATPANCGTKKHTDSHPNTLGTTFYSCFPRLPILIAALQRDQIQSAEDQQCLGLAKLVVRGDIDIDVDPTFGHMFYNLQRYARMVDLKRAPVYVVRTDHLWSDIKEIDSIFSGNSTFGQVDGLKYTHTHGTKRKPHRELPIDVRQRLCCLLEDELSLYRDVLARAENLPSSLAKATWQEAVDYCGESSWDDVKAKCAKDTLLNAIGSSEMETAMIMLDETFIDDPFMFTDKKEESFIDSVELSSLVLIDAGDPNDQSVKVTLNAGCRTLSKRAAQDQCLKNVTASEVSTRVKEYIHVESTSSKVAATKRRQRQTRVVDGYLLIVSHPLDRLMSWYDHANPRACRRRPRLSPTNCETRRFISQYPNSATAEFFQCFPDVRALRKTIRVGDVTNKCFTIAKDALQGKTSNGSSIDPAFGPLVYNLHHWYNTPEELDPGKPLYVIRGNGENNNLWPDMRAVDVMLGGDGTIAFSETTSNSTDSRLYGSPRPFIPKLVRRKMCCLLQDEMMAYGNFLARAKNLPSDIAKTAWKEAIEYCGSFSWGAFVKKCQGGRK